MRRISLFFALIIIFCCFSVSVAAISADGDVQSFEWEGSTSSVLFDKSENSGCNIKQAILKHKFDSNTRELCLAFVCIEGSETSEEDLSGVKLSINGEDAIILGNGNCFDENLYDVECGKTKMMLEGFTYEVKIILKKHGYEKIDIDVVFTDTYGAPSKEYKMCVYDKVNEEMTFSLPPSIVVTEGKTKKVTTTKTKTTKLKTTKTTTKKPKEMTSEGTTMKTEVEQIDVKSYEKHTKNQKILRYVSVGGIVTALVAVVAFSVHGED